jgi:hypothetical protein
MPRGTNLRPDAATRSEERLGEVRDEVLDRNPEGPEDGAQGAGVDRLVERDVPHLDAVANDGEIVRPGETGIEAGLVERPRDLARGYVRKIGPLRRSNA